MNWSNHMVGPVHGRKMMKGRINGNAGQSLSSNKWVGKSFQGVGPEYHHITTSLREHTLERLLLDACTKTLFSFKNQQIDGICMGSPLGPTLADILMTAFEEEIVKPLISSNVIKFYSHYVDNDKIIFHEK